MSDESILYREPTEAEVRLLKKLASSVPNLDQAWLEGVRVRTLSDGGMGSVQLAPAGFVKPERCFGSKASECQFTDADGVDVFITLNLDQDGQPFEMDVWKADFTPLIRVPESL